MSVDRTTETNDQIRGAIPLPSKSGGNNSLKQHILQRESTRDKPTYPRDRGEIGLERLQLSSGVPKRVLYPRSNRTLAKVPVTGGTPIDEEMCMALRQVVFGSCANPPRGEWSRTGLTLRAGGQAMAFGIRAARNSTRSLVTAVQAVMLKHFLFKNTPSLKRVVTGGTIGAGNSSVLTPAETLLKPNHERQVEVLSLSIAEVIWRCGSADATINHSQGDTANFGITSPKAIVVLPQDVPYVQHSTQYFQDGITETLHVFEFSNLDDLQIFVKRYLYLFQDEGGPGAIILLYSAVLSRGIARIRNDLEDPRTSILPGCSEEGPVSIVVLLLTGRCSPHLHNGVLHVGDENTYAIPRWGVLTRSEVGILVHDGEVAGGVSRQPGSRLKTPSLPIWVTLCQGHFGVLFNTNRELLRNYHAERRFEIHYYTTSGSNVTLTVDTRAVNSRDIASAGANNLPDSGVPRDMQEQIVDVATTPLEKLIHTKWQDAQIQWNGTPVL